MATIKPRIINPIYIPPEPVIQEVPPPQETPDSFSDGGLLSFLNFQSPNQMLPYSPPVGAPMDVSGLFQDRDAELRALVAPPVDMASAFLPRDAELRALVSPPVDLASAFLPRDEQLRSDTQDLAPEFYPALPIPLQNSASRVADLGFPDASGYLQTSPQDAYLDIPKPNITPYRNDFGPVPVYDRAGERERVKRGRPFSIGVGLLSLLGSDPAFALRAFANAEQGLQAGARGEEERELDLATRDYGLNRQNVLDTNNITEAENRMAIDAYNREVNNEIRGEESRMRAINNEANRELRALQIQNEAAKAEDLKEYRANALKQRQTEATIKTRQQEIRDILNFAKTGRLTPAAEAQLAGKLQELMGLNGLTPDFIMSMTAAEKERLDISRMSAEDRNRHWLAQEEEDKRQFDKKLVADTARENRANALKLQIASMKQNSASGAGGKGLTPNAQLTALSKSLTPLAQKVSSLRTKQRGIHMRLLDVNKDINMQDNRHPTGLNEAGRRRLASLQNELNDVTGQISSAELDYEQKEQEVQGFLRANMTLNQPNYGNVNPTQPAPGSVVTQPTQNSATPRQQVPAGGTKAFVPPIPGSLGGANDTLLQSIGQGQYTTPPVSATPSGGRPVKTSGSRILGSRPRTKN